jgi:hypothetical protein
MDEKSPISRHLRKAALFTSLGGTGVVLTLLSSYFLSYENVIPIGLQQEVARLEVNPSTIEMFLRLQLLQCQEI